MRVIVDNKIPFIKEAIEKIADSVIYTPGRDFTPELVKDADALIIRTRTRCNKELLEGSKVRFKHLGSAHTEAKFVYNHLNGRYWPCEEDIIHTPQGERPGPVNTQFDNENWLKNNEEQGRLFE